MTRSIKKLDVVGEVSNRRTQRSFTIAGPALTRIAVLPVTAAFSLLTAHIVLGYTSASTYGYVTLVATLVQLLPFADLGLGAAITNAFSEKPSATQRVKNDRVLVSALRILILVALVIAILAFVGSLTGIWAWALSVSPVRYRYVNWAVGGVLALFGISVPLGAAQRILVAVGRNTTLIVLQALTGVFTFGLVSLALSAHVDTSLFPLAWGGGSLLVGLTCAIVAARSTHIEWRHIFAEIPRIRIQRSIRLWDTAGPMFLMTMAVPIALQSDRLIISAQSNLTQVSYYSLVMMLYAPIVSIPYATSQSLWSYFSYHGRGGKESSNALARSTVTFTIAGLVAAVGLLVFSRFVLSFVAPGPVHLVPYSLLFAAAGLMLVQFCRAPSGVLLTDARGLRFQAKYIVLMLPINLGLSWVLAPALGATGPIFASAVTVLCFQLIPTVWGATARSKEMNAPDISQV